MTNTLLVDQRNDHITVLTLNRAEQRNALDFATMHALAEAIGCLAAEPELRAVIITGAGSDAFCSGGDLHELHHYASEADGRMMISLMGDALMALERLPVPVIAAMNGYALGGGSELALACDLRIADEKTRMGFVQAKMGLTTGWGAGQRLLRLVGYARAMDMLLSSRVMHAPELLAVGLVNRVVEKGSALEHALHYAQHVTQHAPLAIRGMKTLLQAGINQSYEQALQTERELFPPLWADEPHIRAVEAFFKRDRGHS
ncbi:MAG: enoyl-CoA hydratase/isomerase family protein [Chloroflexi bacterium]|nr:enoyl-CoA hydratase/isomerase family protein [Chloroflexota bacterium]MCC6893966.1 enoyl-CoA hydratase/isomerase family protein [Anaerolineae bacterium]